MDALQSPWQVCICQKVVAVNNMSQQGETISISKRLLVKAQLNVPRTGPNHSSGLANKRHGSPSMFKAGVHLSKGGASQQHETTRSNKKNLQEDACAKAQHNVSRTGPNKRAAVWSQDLPSRDM